MKIAIVTDSGSALTREQGRELGIYVIPLQVIDGSTSYRDGEDISTEQLYDLLRENHTPKTSMPLNADIEEVLKEIKASGYEEVVAVPLSSGLSSTYNALRISAEIVDIPITIIEDYTTCDLQKHDALLALKCAQKGMSSAAIKEYVEGKIAQSGTQILPNDIQHLKRGGRLTPIAAAAASLLKIKPILKIDPSTMGKIDVYDKVRTYKKAANVAVQAVVDFMQQDAGDVYVIHSDCLDKAEEIRAMIQSMCPQVQVHIHTICAVISAHTGLDCIAIQYIKK